MRTATVAERPDLVEPGWERTRNTLPEYNDHGDVLNVYWGRLTAERPEFQFHLVDAETRSWPVRDRSRCAGTARSRICLPGSMEQSRAASTKGARTCSARS